MPRSFQVVLVKGARQFEPWMSLEDSTCTFATSVKQALLLLKFKHPTSIQTHAWPYLCMDHTCSTFLVAPTGSGKSLAFLLPLVSENKLIRHSQGPSLVILVDSSQQANRLLIQLKKILSWINPIWAYRCCCTYLGVEREATISLVNGVDVMVATPTSLLRLLKTNLLSLQHVQQLVVDNVVELHEQFSSELEQIMTQCTKSVLGRVVYTASKWSPLLLSLSTGQPSVFIVADSVEALIMTNSIVSARWCMPHKRLSTMLSIVADHIDRGIVICTASSAQNSEVKRFLQHHSIFCYVVTESSSPVDIKNSLQSSSALVVEDSVVPFLSGLKLEVANILHFSLPLYKKRFLQRLTLFFPMLEREEQCCCTLLVSEEDHNRSKLIVELLQRSKQNVPVALKNMAHSYQEERRRDHDVCYNLKAWGDCKVNWCPSVHTMPSLPTNGRVTPAPNTLPSSGTVEVRVVHVSNATRLWVSLLRHYPAVRGGKCVSVKESSAGVCLSLQLLNHYSDPSHRIMQENVEEGTFCAVEDTNGSIYRVRVLKFSHPLDFCFPHKEKARVRLIDDGSVQIVDLNQLLVLPDEFILQPPQVIEVFLCGVRPSDQDSDWCKEALELVQNQLEGNILSGRIALTSGQTLWLDPVEILFNLSGIKMDLSLQNPVKSLIKGGFAIENPVHIHKLKAVLSSKLSPPEENDVEIKWAEFQAVEPCDVFVTCVISPSHFYVQQASEAMKLRSIESCLNSAQAPKQGTCQVFSPGQCCAARRSQDNRWYRGLVLSVAAEKFEVLFIDTGCKEVVDSKFLEPIETNLLELPAQAIRCSFTKQLTHWPAKAGEKLSVLTQETLFAAQLICETGETQTNKLSIICLKDKVKGFNLLDRFLLHYMHGQDSKWLREFIMLSEHEESMQSIVSYGLKSLMVINPKYFVLSAKDFSSS